MGKSSPSDLFAERLRIAREARELNQAELADKAGLQGSAISHFETGGRRPSFANLRRLADALQVSTDYLLGRTEDMASTANVDVLFRNIGALSDRDRAVIRDLASQMASKKRNGDGGGEGA